MTFVAENFAQSVRRLGLTFPEGNVFRTVMNSYEQLRNDKYCLQFMGHIDVKHFECRRMRIVASNTAWILFDMLLFFPFHGEVSTSSNFISKLHTNLEWNLDNMKGPWAWCV